MQRSVASYSRVGTGGGGPHSVEGLLLVGKIVALFAGNLAPIDEHGKLTVRPVHEIDLGIGLFPQQFRHTGGMTPDRASDGALSNRDLFHGMLLSNY